MSDLRAGRYASGADALLLETVEGDAGVCARAVVEIKSMQVSRPKMEAQLAQHLGRLERGIRLGVPGEEQQTIDRVILSADSPPLRIAVRPATHRFSREFYRETPSSLPTPRWWNTPPPDSHALLPRAPPAG